MPIGPAPITAPTSPGAMRARRRLHADSEGLHHRALGEGYVVRQPVGEGGGMHDMRGQHAMHRRRRPEGHVGIDVVDAEFRGARGEIGHARLHADAVADLQPGHARARLDNRPRRLVAQHHRRLDDERANAAVGVIVNVAAADADRVDGDPNLAGTHRLRQVDFA